MVEFPLVINEKFICERSHQASAAPFSVALILKSYENRHRATKGGLYVAR